MKEASIQLEVGAFNQPRTLFKPGSWLAKVDFINHLILFNNVLITVLSEKQGGKTSFSNLLQNNLDQQIKSVSLTIKAPCDVDAIVSDIAAQLHLNNDVNSNIGSLVDQINERKAHVLLVIDDAQHLPESFIKEAMVAIKNQAEFGFFHLCLVSDYSLVATLNALAVEQFNNLIHTIELGSLNESETRTYVLQRAMAARLINRPLSDIQFKQFYQATKGSVAKINANLESFIYKCATQQKNNNIFSLKKVSAAIAATVVVGFSYIYFDNMYKPSANSETLSAEGKKEVQLALQQVNFELSQELSADSKIASWQDSSTRELVQASLPKTQNLSDITGNMEGSTLALVERVAISPAADAKPSLEIPAVKSNAIVQESLLMKIENSSNEIAQSAIYSGTKTIAQTTVTTNPNSLAKSTIPPASQLEAKATIKNESLVNTAKTAKYTIQLVASHNINDVNRFRKINNLHAITQVRHFKNEKGSWYVLTVGEYNTLNKAQQTVSTLPPTLAKLNPWVRPVRGLESIA